MYIALGDIIIRDFEQKDATVLYQIVREKDIVRFMRDWSENSAKAEAYIDWLQSQKDSTDIYENKRYAIVLRETDELIGMVGMGLEETLNEVEMAYFMSEKYQRRGFTEKAVNALTEWCFDVSDISYLILTIDYANKASCRLAKKCGYKLFELRKPIGYKQYNMESDSYYYYRCYRK